MFEGWVADLLASYLGHFVNIKREQLRISLWQGDNEGAEKAVQATANRVRMTKRD